MHIEERIDSSRSDGRSNGEAAKAGSHGDEHGIPVDLPELSRGAVVLIGVVVLALFATMFLIGFVPHRREQAEANRAAEETLNDKPVVEVITPRRSDATIDLVLPADVQAFQATSLFARTNGYLKPLASGIDIGAKVKTGQVLAEIAAPEVDAELEQAKAALQQAQVTVGRATNEFNLRKATFDRYTAFAETGGVTQQQLDERRSDYNIANSSLKAANATVAAAEANVKRLTEMQGFQKIVAPFDGVIAARNFDAGALISVNSSGGGRELFRLVQSDRLRVFVNVPQTYATQVKPEQEADLFVRNYPGKGFTGKVARSTSVIDPTTRTLRVEVDIPNDAGQLYAGMWGQVRFKIRQDQPPVVLPTSALVYGTDGMKVAMVESGDKVRFQKIAIGRDFGPEAEVVEGLKGDERIVGNPSERLADGVEVNVLAAKHADNKSTAQAAAK